MSASNLEGVNINQLPRELLIKVFELVFEADWKSRCSDPNTSCRTRSWLLEVCPYWKRLIFDTPSLWRLIICDFYKDRSYLKEYLNENNRSIPSLEKLHQEGTEADQRTLEDTLLSDNLKEVTLSAHQLDLSLRCLSILETIRTVHIIGVCDRKLEKAKDEFFTFLAASHHLRTLKFEGDVRPLEHIQLYYYVQNDGLIELELSNQTLAQNKTLISLIAINNLFPCLRKIKLKDVRVPYAHVKYTDGSLFEHLEDVHIKSCEIEDCALFLCRSKKLKRIHIQDCRISREVIVTMPSRIVEEFHFSCSDPIALREAALRWPGARLHVTLFDCIDKQILAEFIAELKWGSLLNCLTHISFGNESYISCHQVKALLSEANNLRQIDLRKCSMILCSCQAVFDAPFARLLDRLRNIESNWDHYHAILRKRRRFDPEDQRDWGEDQVI